MQEFFLVAKNTQTNWNTLTPTAKKIVAAELLAKALALGLPITPDATGLVDNTTGGNTSSLLCVMQRMDMQL